MSSFTYPNKAQRITRVHILVAMVTDFKAEWKTKDLSNTLQKADVYHQVLEAMKFGLAHHLNLEDPDFSEQSKQVDQFACFGRKGRS